MIYVAVLMACLSPIANTCQIQAKKVGYADKADCEAQVDIVLDLLEREQIIGAATCLEVSLGVEA